MVPFDPVQLPALSAGRRQPAYAKALLLKRRAGLAPRKDLVIATEWNFGRHWSPWRIVVDPRHAAVTFDFSVCAGLSCLLCASNSARMDEIATVVLTFQPLCLLGVSVDAPRCTIYRRRPEELCA